MINAKEELLLGFENTKFGRNLTDNEWEKIKMFYDYFVNAELDRKIRNCELELCKLLNKKYDYERMNNKE